MTAAAHTLTQPRTNLLAPFVALLAGATLTVGVLTAVDSNELASPPAKLVVVDTPAQPGPGLAAKDEAGVAAAIAGGPQLRGSKASVGSATQNPAQPQADDSGPVTVDGLSAGLGRLR